MRWRRLSEEPADKRLDMLARQISLGIGASRVAIGVGMLFAPRISLATLGFGAAEGPTLAITRLAGARDLALGALALAAHDDRRQLGKLTLVAAGVDASDAASFAVALLRGEAPTRGAGIGVLMASNGAIAGTWAAKRLVWPGSGR